MTPKNRGMDGMTSKAFTIVALLAVAGLFPTDSGIALAAIDPALHPADHCSPVRTGGDGPVAFDDGALPPARFLLVQADLHQQQLILELERQRLEQERKELEEMRRLQQVREQRFLELQIERQRNQLPTNREQYQPQQYRPQDYRPQRGQPQQYQRQQYQPQQFRRQ